MEERLRARETAIGTVFPVFRSWPQATVKEPLHLWQTWGLPNERASMAALAPHAQRIV